MNEEDEFSKLASLRKCPNCGKELEKGYIASGEGVAWNTEWHKFKFWGGEPIVGKAWLTPPKIPSLRCRHCRIIISHYGFEDEKHEEEKKG